jgi:hypothetical protein
MIACRSGKDKSMERQPGRAALIIERQGELRFGSRWIAGLVGPDVGADQPHGLHDLVENALLSKLVTV